MITSEAALLRDLPFTLQGLSASHLKFVSESALEIPTNLPLPIISIQHSLAEPSLLYRSLSGFVAHHDTVVESGDHVIVFVENRRIIPKVEKLFQVNVAFF